MTDLMPLTSRLLRDDSAIVSILVAGTMMLSISMAGFAVDFGRGEFAKVELQAALDAGALAGGRSFNTDATEMENVALSYFGANWGDPFSSVLANGTPTYTPSSNLQTMTGFAQINVPTTMLWAIGQKNMVATANDVVLTPGQAGGLELAMVIDNTGSEAAGCKMFFVISAAQGMINQLYGVPNPSTANVISDGCNGSGTSATYTVPAYTKPAEPTYTPPAQAPNYFWTSIIPFVTQVSPVAPGSADMTNWIKNGWVNTRHENEFPTGDQWQGCVEARLATAPGDTTNDVYGGEDAVTSNLTLNGINLYGVELNPGQAPFQRYFFPSDDDIGRTPSAANPFEIQPMDYPVPLTSGNAADINYPYSTTTTPKEYGEPNAPVWPAFNVWNQNTSGATTDLPPNLPSLGAPNPPGGVPEFNIPNSLNTTGNSPATVVCPSCRYIVNSFAPNGATSEDNCSAITALAITCTPIGGRVATTNDEFADAVTNNSGFEFPPNDPNWPDDTTTTTNSTSQPGYKSGPNLGCPAPMLVMSSDYPTIMQNLAAMYPMSLGGTTTSVGLSWGFRVLSPNWAIAAPAPGVSGGTTTNVWQAGADTGIAGVNLPLPYNSVLTSPTGGKISMNKVVIFMTDGNNQWFTNVGGNTYTAYKTVDHTPLFDQQVKLSNGKMQAQPWNAATDIAASAGGVIPPSLSLQTVPTSLTTTTVDAYGNTMEDRETTASSIWTTNAWNLCQAMQADGIIMYTILLEFKTTDISSTIADGYAQNCATDPQAGTHFYELTGSQVSELATVFTAIGNDLSALRLSQ
jgi:hypothetical protein